MPLEFSRVTLAGPLWTVAEAKQLQLRITDASHDEDIEQKLGVAQEAILALLGTSADATWTPTTAPLAVKHAIFLLATHYYEHRGDDMDPQQSGGTPDEKVWNAIYELLGRHRDPTLG